jgi:hypothetical protein
MNLKNKRGFLFTNLILIIIAITFLGILYLFVAKQGNGAIVLEQSYAKNIALLIDASTPVMEMRLNMPDAFELAEKNKINVNEIVKIQDNYVIVKLSEKGGYRYSFFNDVEVVVYPDVLHKDYIIFIKDYKEELK